MAVRYKKLIHFIIDEDISYQDLMRMSNIFANIITKLHTGQYIAKESGRHMYDLHCKPTDIMEFKAEEQSK